jgi:channel protein (hemolysin III family)
MEIYPIPGFAEPFNSLSHLLGAGAFAVLGFFLLRRGQGSVPRLLSLAVFVFSCAFLLSMSGVYHLLSAGGTGHRVLQRLDHAAIFTLIAGSFTPVHWMLFRGWGRWGVLSLIWGLAATGIALKAIFFDRIPEWLGLSLFLGLGWIGLASGFALWRRYGWGLVKPLACSGLSYTAGGLLEFLRTPTLIPGVLGPHELMHIAVLAGIGFHFRFLFGAMERVIPRNS